MSKGQKLRVLWNSKSNRMVVGGEVAPEVMVEVLVKAIYFTLMENHYSPLSVRNAVINKCDQIEEALDKAIKESANEPIN